MTSKLSLTVSFTIASKTARIAVSGTLTAENAPTVIAVARRVSRLDEGFDVVIDISGLTCPDAEGLHTLQSSGFRMAGSIGSGTRPAPRRSTKTAA
jgi:anti-anti-sigma regulatory factor